MHAEALAAALEHEHDKIDERIAAFAAAPWDRQLLTDAIGALRRHIYLEEEFLFPQLHRAEPALAAPVFVMLREHAQIWATLDSLERELNAGAAATPAAGKRLTLPLLHHNLKEEKILYPRADDLLPPAAADRLRAFLAAEELPDGWVCTLKARHAGQSRPVLAVSSDTVRLCRPRPYGWGSLRWPRWSRRWTRSRSSRPVASRSTRS